MAPDHRGKARKLTKNFFLTWKCQKINSKKLFHNKRQKIALKAILAH
jgi:hypothetical protein